MKVNAIVILALLGAVMHLQETSEVGAVVLRDSEIESEDKDDKPKKKKKKKVPKANTPNPHQEEIASQGMKRKSQKDAEDEEKKQVN